VLLRREIPNRSIAAIGFLAATLLSGADTPREEIWRFDRIDQIGGHPVTVLGHPRVIDTPQGKAIAFNGQDDALLVDVHPLAGAGSFTWEVVFRPDADGALEQRFFHLQERDPSTGQDTQSRMLLEIRIVNGGWALDGFVRSGVDSKTLLDREKLHSLDAWHHAALVYDGRDLRNYVDGVLQGSAPFHMTPQAAGHSSIGVRINRVNYFKGAIRVARMTPRALTPEEFLK